MNPAIQEFVDTATTHAQWDPTDTILGNVESNVGTTLDRMTERRQHADAAQRLQLAVELQEQKRRNRDGVKVAEWEAVPESVQSLYLRVFPIGTKLAAMSQECPMPQGAAVAFDPARDCLHVIGGECDTARMQEKLASIGVRQVVTAHTMPEAHDLVLIKTANDGYLAPVANGLAAVQRPFGGPSPLTSAIVGGLLGGGLGYGGGWLLEKLLPEKQFAPGRLSKVLAGVGAGVGAMPGAWWGTLKHRSDPRNPGQTFEDQGAGWTSSYPFRPEDYDKSAEFRKEANLQNRVGALFMPTIPVDAFNKAVWNDVHQSPNPFGTKSPWGDNSQPLSTPPPVAAAASGIVAGASAARGGSSNVSIWDVARAGAVGGGKGLLAGLVGAKVIGAIAGLRPEYQRKIWQTGAAAGALTNAMNVVFGQ